MYLLLPGFSIKNKEEAEAIASALRDLGKDIYIFIIGDTGAMKFSGIQQKR